MGKEQLQPKSQGESLSSHEVSKEQSEKLKKNLEKESREAETESKDALEQARKSVESEAVSGKETSLKGGEKEGQKQSVTRAEKTRSYKSTMSRVQQQLPTLSRGFSKAIHNPAIEKVSESVGKTVARPSGILGAGVFGFIGFSAVFFFANRNGFTINQDSSLIILLMLAGWIVGVLIELVLKALKRNKTLK